MLGHDLFLYPELTARENLMFFARLYGLADAPARAMAGARARRTWRERADDEVSGFSRGMRQRVALERALLHEPRLLLLDEPFTGLDQASTGALVARLREEQARRLLIILATHDLDVADGLLTRALFLHERPAAGDGGGERSVARALPGRGGGVMKAFFRVAWLVVRKDLTVEVRSLEVLSTTLFFAVTVVLVFSFGLVARGPRRWTMWRRRSCGLRSRSRARWRWAAPSSASARTTRCARCCWRPPIGRRSMSASWSASCCCWGWSSSCSCRWSGCCSRRRSSTTRAR